MATWQLSSPATHARKGESAIRSRVATLRRRGGRHSYYGPAFLILRPAGEGFRALCMKPVSVAYSRIESRENHEGENTHLQRLRTGKTSLARLITGQERDGNSRWEKIEARHQPFGRSSIFCKHPRRSSPVLSAECTAPQALRTLIFFQSFAAAPSSSLPHTFERPAVTVPPINAYTSRLVSHGVCVCAHAHRLACRTSNFRACGDKRR